MKFIYVDSKGLDVLIDDPFHDIRIGTIVLEKNGVYVFRAFSSHDTITDVDLRQIADKISELNQLQDLKYTK